MRQCLRRLILPQRKLFSHGSFSGQLLGIIESRRQHGDEFTTSSPFLNFPAKANQIDAFACFESYALRK